jgi:ATP-dependent exoDNAse (exonuclease V) beta subunit
VDGAYNIRYEIIKKRIDKAVIKGSAERLTQPGKIAIIYSQAKEALEYRQYIDYLQAAAYLTGEVEEVELEDLQGLQGLKALRVTVNMQPPLIQERAAPAEMEEAIQATSGMVT